MPVPVRVGPGSGCPMSDVEGAGTGMGEVVPVSNVKREPGDQRGLYTEVQGIMGNGHMGTRLL